MYTFVIIVTENYYHLNLKTVQAASRISTIKYHKNIPMTKIIGTTWYEYILTLNVWIKTRVQVSDDF